MRPKHANLVVFILTFLLALEASGAPRPPSRGVSPEVLVELRAIEALYPAARTNTVAWEKRVLDHAISQDAVAEVLNQLRTLPEGSSFEEGSQGHSGLDSEGTYATLSWDQKRYVLTATMLLYQEDNALEGALGFVLQELRSKLSAIVSRYHPNAPSAEIEDLVAETLRKMQSSASRFDDSRGDVYAWASTIAKNTAIDMLRRHQTEEAAKEMLSRVEPTYEQMIERYRQDLMQKCINKAKNNYRVSIWQKGNPQIAEFVARGEPDAAIHRSIGASRTTIKKHRQAFRAEVARSCADFAPGDFPLQPPSEHEPPGTVDGRVLSKGRQ